MESRRQRAREQFPQVLLAVLGIIQALALELLWERGVAGLDRWEAIDAWATGALQVFALFLGIVLLWVLFATIVLRFRWLPRFRDLVLPFALGGLEFMLVECMAPDQIVRWFLVLTLIFAAAAATSYGTFNTALAEDDLARGAWTQRERIASFLPTMVAVATLPLCALAAGWAGPASFVTAVALVVACAGLFAQLLSVRYFWYRDLDGAS